MVKSEIISKVSDKIHRKIKKSDLEKIFNTIIDTIIYEAKHNNKSTEIKQFGRFSRKIIKEKMNARNPRTGETIQSKKKVSITFKMSKELKNKINNGFGWVN